MTATTATSLVDVLNNITASLGEKISQRITAGTAKSPLRFRVTGQVNQGVDSSVYSFIDMKIGEEKIMREIRNNMHKGAQFSNLGCSYLDLWLALHEQFKNKLGKKRQLRVSLTQIPGSTAVSIKKVRRQLSSQCEPVPSETPDNTVATIAVSIYIK